MAADVNPGLLIEIDGGVDANNAHLLVNTGANVLVAGSAVFSSASPAAVISSLKHPKKLQYL